MNADEFRDYILGFIFFKYLSERMNIYANSVLVEDGIDFKDIDEDTEEGKAYLEAVSDATLDAEYGVRAVVGVCSERPILLKNSVFGKIGEIFVRTAPPTFRSEGFGQIGLLPLMWQLTAPHRRSHLTFRYRGFFPKNHNI
jgi:hypothetical protein